MGGRMNEEFVMKGRRVAFGILNSRGVLLMYYCQLLLYCLYLNRLNKSMKGRAHSSLTRLQYVMRGCSRYGYYAQRAGLGAAGVLRRES